MKLNDHIHNYYKLLQISSDLEVILKEELDENIYNARFDEEEEYLKKEFDIANNINYKIKQNVQALCLMSEKREPVGNTASNTDFLFLKEGCHKINISELKKIIDIKDIGLLYQIQKENKTIDKSPDPKNENKKVKSEKPKTKVQTPKVQTPKVQKIEETFLCVDDLLMEDLLFDDIPDIKIAINQENLQKENPVIINKNEKNLDIKLKKQKTIIQEEVTETDGIESKITAAKKEDFILKEKSELDNSQLELEIPIIDDEINHKVLIQNHDVFSPKDLIADDYTIQYYNEDNDLVKTISILAIPLEYSTDNIYMSQIMVLTKSESQLKLYVSEDIKRPSVHLKIDEESFVLRGSWVNEAFQTLLYPQNANGFRMIKKLNSMRPEKIKNCGHITEQVGTKLLHIFPLSSQNNKNGMVNVIVCVENKEKNEYEIYLSSQEKQLKKNQYQVSAKWNEGKLTVNIIN